MKAINITIDQNCLKTEIRKKRQYLIDMVFPVSPRQKVALDNPNRLPLQTGQFVLVCRVFKKLYF